MTVETFETADLITVTPAAAAHFQHQLQHGQGASVRVGVKESGCSGFMYVLDQVDAPQDSDLKITLDNGVELYVDQDAIPILRGSEIDYAGEGINRIIKFNNPNAASACGCGESFNLNE